MTIMSPYRRPITQTREVTDNDPPDDDRLLAWALLVIGGIRVVIAFAEHEVFGAEATIALFMVVMAIMLLLQRR